MTVKTYARSMLLLIVISASLLSAACGKEDARLFTIGHSGGNQVAALYAASAEEGFSKVFSAEKIGSSADIGYALLSGDIDAGFVEADKLEALEKLPGFEKLTAVGNVTYPYGATLVLRKGLNLRINELNGLKIAVSSPECLLLAAFLHDAGRFNADVSGVTYETMAFDAMIPALEAKAVDAAIIKGSYSIIALHQGHSILYQNWDVEPGDECCPAIIDQAALVLLTHKEKRTQAETLVSLLLAAQNLGQDALRRAIARETTIPLELLEGQPVAEFGPADDSLVEIFVGHSHEEGEAHEDEEEAGDDDGGV